MTLCESYSKDCGLSILQSSGKKVFLGLSKGYIEKVGLGEGEGSSKGVRPRSSQSSHKKLSCDTPGESSSQKPDISVSESGAKERGTGLCKGCSEEVGVSSSQGSGQGVLSGLGQGCSQEFS